MSIINIASTPKETLFNEHYYCDYIELLALIENGSPVSKSDIFDRFLEDNRISTSGSSQNFQTNNIWDTRIINWYTLLKSRESLFSDFYPFEITNNNITTSIKMVDEITDKMKSYIFLLLSSLQKYFERHNCSKLTSDFEEFSLQAFKKYIPAWSEAYRFGKSGLNYNRYTGDITNKIDDFASDIKCRTIYEENYFASNNNGDGGLDIVSWVPFKNDDNFNNIQVYLGQCATGKDWLHKQDDTDKFINNFILFKTDVQKVMFVPYDGRNEDRTFNEQAQMNKSIYFDRLRLLTLIEDNIDDILMLDSFNSIIEPVIEYEEDII